MKLEYTIKKDSTIKEFIYQNISRNFFGYLKEHNVIYTVNGITKKSYENINTNDYLVITYDEEKNQTGLYCDKGLDILYEDEYYMVINKPANLQSIPSRNNPNDSVFNRLLYYFKDTFYTVHLLNRLDKETKGLVLVAKSNYAAALLKSFNKKYVAVTHNRLPFDDGVIDLPIAKIDNSIKREISEKGKKSITLYKLIDSNELYTYEIELKTGRTHQIRVHFSYNNCPLINDTLYGGIEYGDLSLGLTCKEISFLHPITNKLINIKV